MHETESISYSWLQRVRVNERLRGPLDVTESSTCCGNIGSKGREIRSDSHSLRAKELLMILETAWTADAHRSTD